MKNLMHTLQDDTRLHIFSSALVEAGLGDILEGLGPFTVFAPTDTAFEELPANRRDAIMGDRDRLSTTLRYHILLVGVDTMEMANLEDTRSLRGDMVMFDVSDGVAHVNGIPIIQADIECTNGILHIIDGVLIPEWDVW
jgi:uncharacterized surface protein with fasciclin (FAS1) repeats